MTVVGDFGGRDYRTMEDPFYGRTRDAARADSQPKLVMHVRKDDAGREIREFQYDRADAPKTWMHAYSLPPQRMVVLDNQGRGLQWAERRKKQILAEERATAQQIREHGIESIRANLEV